ncbi:MAG: aspartate kinase, partial [Bacteroidales bacterium]|nr:aspartate kinase [Bacteroidales bacterium]
MKVLKFGGTSVGSASRMKQVYNIINNGEKKIVVLSAMSGTTNALLEIAAYLYKKNPDAANELINNLELKYFRTVDELYESKEYSSQAIENLKAHFEYIRSFTKKLFTLFEEKALVAQGELLSTMLFNLYLNECGIKSVLLPALDFMRINKNAEPETQYLREHLMPMLEANSDAEMFVTQGFICLNAYGEVDNLT